MQKKEHGRALGSLGVGQSGTICAVLTEGSMRRRMQDLGLIRGARVDCVGVSPLGDPKAFRICGAVIALRRADADTVRLFR